MSIQPGYDEGSSSKYRAYEIGDDGHCLAVLELTATSDKDAVHQTFRMVIGHVWELWDRERLVITLRPHLKGPGQSQGSF
ncbi:hypothetical protein [Lichenifustis flavocetrariae]|uniref:Uncharacterized protein n=1 Tax=Lichenifustis flavocetrariae TaxID=2949735 RepID=A0AA41ZA25_9HYPH|nr:hypothetical protein [Lichenifustis flavocetrariae]MCW6513060.1 hypothetical protein [Lichenifustis flavocetrariae]